MCIRDSIIGAQQGDQPGAQHLEERAQHDDPGVAVSIGQDLSLIHIYRDGTAWELEREHVFQKEGRPDYCANAGEDGLLILNWFLREAPPDLEDLEAVEVNGIRCPVA